MSASKMHADELDIEVALVRHLLAAQFPEWAELPIKPVQSAGTDHALFRLGVQPDAAVAFGDGENDVNMFRVVGYSVSMSNAKGSLTTDCGGWCCAPPNAPVQWRLPICTSMLVLNFELRHV